MAKRGTEMSYELKVTLREVRPAIWRRVRVAGSLTLRDLHHVLQVALGWTDSHLHEFEIRGRRYGMPDSEEDYGESPLDEVEYRLGELVRVGDRFEYVYDFGDNWRHEVVAEKRVPLERDAPKADCLAGKRACPPEDCGSTYGYAHLLEVLADPKHEEHAELREWVGPDFAPESFDAAWVSRQLRGAGSAAWRRRRERYYHST